MCLVKILSCGYLDGYLGRATPSGNAQCKRSYSFVHARWDVCERLFVVVIDHACRHFEMCVTGHLLLCVIMFAVFVVCDLKGAPTQSGKERAHTQRKARGPVT